MHTMNPLRSREVRSIARISIFRNPRALYTSETGRHVSRREVTKRQSYKFRRGSRVDKPNVVQTLGFGCAPAKSESGSVHLPCFLRSSVLGLYH